MICAFKVIPSKIPSPSLVSVIDHSNDLMNKSLFQVRRQFGSHGPSSRQGGRERHGRHGFVRFAGRGNGNPRERAGPRLRVYDGIH